MASLSNINGLFDVHSTGAILFSTSHGTSGQILRSNGNAAPTWVAASTVIGGPYLPLTGGTLSGATATATGINFTVGGNLSGTSATFSGDLTITGNQYFNGEFIEGDGKEMFRYNDAWLRINEDNDFTSGIYCGTGILRTDGEFQVGGSGSNFKVTSAGVVSALGNITAPSFNGLAINTTGTNNLANQIVRTDVNGYVNFGWINSISGATTSTITRITASNDAYLRYVTPATFRTQITDPYYAPAGTVSGVTSVATGNGLTGGTITTTGTLSMSGSYTGGFTATTSMYSPIYYDSANGAYYGDFASTSVFNKINTGIGNLGRSSMASYSMTAGNWYRIANGVGRACGDIYIQDGISSGPHGNLTFYAGSSYSQYAGTMLKLKSSSFYNVIGFTEIRLLIGTTYQEQYVEIYCQRTGTYYITVQDTHTSTNNWALSTSATVGSVPAGYSDSTRLDINGMLIAEAGNGSNRFAVDRVGAIHLSGGTSGSSGQVLTSGGTGSPTWTTLQNQTGGPFLPLAGGTMSGDIIFNSNIRLEYSSTHWITPRDSSGNMHLYINSAGDGIYLDSPFTYIRQQGSEGNNVYIAGGAITSTGIIQSNASVRAPIFYDSNDINSYFEANRIVMRGSDPTIIMRDTSHRSAMMHVNSDRWYLLGGAVDSSSWTQVGGQWPLYIELANNNAYFGGFVQATTSSRAPIFYDTNTAYYGDFGSTTMGKYFGRQAYNEGFQVGGHNNLGSTSTTTNPIYTIGSSYIPASTTLSNMYGIGFTNAAASFIGMVGASGWGLYVASDGDARVYLDGSTGRVSVTGAMYSPIYYDTNTAYYGNFASTSRLNTLNCDGVITSGTSSTGNIYCGNAGSTHFRFHTVSNTTYFDMNSGTIQWRQGSSTRFYFYPSTANMTINGTLTQNSDIRIKENVIEINDCISKVQGMRGVYYNRTDFNTEVTKVGVIAQEVEAVLPELILENEESGLKSVAYSELTAVLINAIKEQQVIIDDLKSRIEKLEL
jgi:hypothetical protein